MWTTNNSSPTKLFSCCYGSNVAAELWLLFSFLTVAYSSAHKSIFQLSCHQLKQLPTLYWENLTFYTPMLLSISYLSWHSSYNSASNCAAWLLRSIFTSRPLNFNSTLLPIYLRMHSSVSPHWIHIVYCLTILYQLTFNSSHSQTVQLRPFSFSTVEV